MNTSDEAAAVHDDELEAVAQATFGAARAGGGVSEMAAAMLPELRLLVARVRAEAVAGHRADLQHRIEVSTRYEDDRRVALAERDEYHRNWQEAEKRAGKAVAGAVAEERQRIAAFAAQLPKPGPESTAYERGYYAAFSFAREPVWAAGSVPVATPDGPPCCALHGRNCEQGGEECCGYCTESGHDFIGFRTGKHADGSNCSKRDQSPNTLPAAEPSVRSATESSFGVPQDGLVSWAELAEVMQRVSLSSVDAVRYAIIHHAERAAECRPKSAERHVCGGSPCSTQHHAFYGQLCNVPNCGEDFCIGSQEPSVGTGTPTEQWRVGEHYRIHVYAGDRSVATFHQAEDAARAVAAVNASLSADAPAEEVSGGSGHAERQEPAELTVLRREIRHSLLKDVSVQTVDRWLSDFARLSAADGVARYRAAIEQIRRLRVDTTTGFDPDADLNNAFNRGLDEALNVLAAALGDGAQG